MAQTRRLFVSAPPPTASVPAPATGTSAPAAPLVLDDEEAHYATRVLRLADGDAVVALDGHGREAEATLGLVGRRGPATLRLTAPWQAGPALRSMCALHLLVPLPKGERADWMVEKLAELGCYALTFVRSHYSQGAKGPSGGQRLERLERVARAAARQARHGRLPRLSAAEVPLEDALAEATVAAGCGWLAHPDGDAPTLLRALADGALPTKPAHHVLLLGPEGGLTPEEVEAARARGLRPVGLGPHVLRLETAAVAAAATFVQALA